MKNNQNKLEICIDLNKEEDQKLYFKRIKYDFEKNIWELDKTTSIKEAIKIAKKLKKMYYPNKEWLISGNYQNTTVRFIDEAEIIKIQQWGL